jgi:ribulose 1,5-bisphosphate carboxylase large subunit-like protein
VIAFTDAIQAVVSGRSLKEAAEDSPALRSALKKWGA